MHKNLTALLTILLYTCLVGCNNSSIQVQQAAPEEVAYGTETLDMRNCDSNDDLLTTLASEAPVRQEISISEQATVVETGSVIDIPNEVQNELRSQVESVYQPIYEEAAAGTEMVNLTVPGHMIHMYKIHWIRRIYQSTISFSMNEQTCTASYVYTLETPDLDSTTIMACTA
jgi:hypothetical protein